MSKFALVCRTDSLFFELKVSYCTRGIHFSVMVAVTVGAISGLARVAVVVVVVLSGDDARSQPDGASRNFEFRLKGSPDDAAAGSLRDLHTVNFCNSVRDDTSTDD